MLMRISVNLILKTLVCLVTLIKPINTKIPPPPKQN